jgi:hypothetical protein
MLQELGFPDKWVHLTKEILKSAQSSVLLNAVLRKKINAKGELDKVIPYHHCSLYWLLIFSNLCSTKLLKEGFFNTLWTCPTQGISLLYNMKMIQLRHHKGSFSAEKEFCRLSVNQHASRLTMLSLAYCPLISEMKRLCKWLESLAAK